MNLAKSLSSSNHRKRAWFAFAIFFIYAILATLIIICFDGTGDSGDSILHYLYAKYAPSHIELYFNHWAKPLFVLLASPFAQFGFTGMKIFNALVVLLTIILTYRSVQLLDLKNPLLVTVLLIFSPLYFVQTFSGLTEPLFALFTITGIFLILRKKYMLSFLVISFLPFIRSEGLIIMGVFALYGIVKRQWKALPFLIAGHVFYSFAGFFIHGDLLWVFTRIPYARLGSTYGSGTLFHFAEQLNYVIGIPIFILFWAGMFSIILNSFRKKISAEVFILIFLGFLSYFAAHSLFWYFGIFNSMGLKRVLIAVIPLISVIALIGFNFITEELIRNHRIAKLIVQSLIILYILIFPFLSNPAAIKWNKDLNLAEDQVAAAEIKAFLDNNLSLKPRLIYAHPYLSEVFDIDHFNPDKRLELTHDNLGRLTPGDIIIWDNWFAVVENGIKKGDLEIHSELVNIYQSINKSGKREVEYVVFQRK